MSIEGLIIEFPKVQELELEQDMMINNEIIITIKACHSKSIPTKALKVEDS